MKKKSESHLHPAAHHACLIDVLRRRDCFCNNQFNVKSCSMQGIYRTSDVYEWDPESIMCSKRLGSINVMSTYTILDP